MMRDQPQMFANEAHYSRNFTCGWSARAETALSIARRVQAMTRGLGEIDPRMRLLWPQFEARAIRPSDPGPVLDLSDESLADLIDRRARFDPPRFPAPVDPWGYMLALGGSPGRSEMLDYGALVEAGRRREAPFYNVVNVHFDQDHPIWRDPERASTLLGGLVNVWEAEWGYAAGRPEGGSGDTYGHPLLTWAASKGASAPRAFIDIGPPSDVRDYLGGELRVWP